MPILTAQTSVDGFYRLAGMPDGSYLAAVVLPPDFTAISPATVAVNVGDGGAATAHFAIRPDVPNQRPVIDAIPNQEFKVNDAVAIQVHATDADDVVLTYAATGLPGEGEGERPVGRQQRGELHADRRKADGAGAGRGADSHAADLSAGCDAGVRGVTGDG